MDKEACIQAVLFSELTLDQVLRQTCLVLLSSPGNESVFSFMELISCSGAVCIREHSKQRQLLSFQD